MPEETVVTTTTVESTEAERAAEAARQAELSAATLASQVTQNAAEEIAEHQEAVSTLESDVTWLRQETTTIKTALAEVVMMVSSSFQRVEEQILGLQNSLTQQVQAVAEVTAEEAADPAAEAVHQEPATNQKPKNQRRLI